MSASHKAYHSRCRRPHGTSSSRQPNDETPHYFVTRAAKDGIFDADPMRDPSARRISHLTVDRIPGLTAVLGGSHGVDVTGGMVDKITNMALLLEQYPQLRIHLLSGEIPGRLHQHLLDPDAHLGTTLTS